MKFIFTFGIGQAYHHKYVEVKAPDYKIARKVMQKAHQNLWSMQYDFDNGMIIVKTYNLEKLSTLDFADELVQWEK